MIEPAIPLVILGGRDRRDAELPEGERDKHRLRGYKGAEVEIAGRPLVQVVVDRMRATGAFDPIYVAGPARVYEELLDNARIIDTDADFGDNLRASIDAVAAEDSRGQVAFVTGDVLPDPGELRSALEDLRRHQPVDFWMPQVRVPVDHTRLGASAWKPKYRLRPPGEPEPVPILPSHLIIADYRNLRLRFVYRFFELLYRTRNRPLSERRWVLTRTLLWSLMLEDLRHLAAGRLPHIFVPVVYNSLVLASKLKAGVATTADFEDRLRRVFFRRAHRLRFPNRRGRVPVIHALSLAKDIDTEEEAREIASPDCS
ncbi:MAG: NTP transferase domain-containing protein [Holophagales bacterium]|nr:NTP transferase domain-containing protein [Holophagales bacterium]